MSYRLRSWWRYTRLQPAALAASVAVTVECSIIAWASGNAVLWLLAVCLGAAVLALFVRGLARAERARRYGCW